MASRNPYTYTPGYSGTNRGYAASGSRAAPPRSGARAQVPPARGGAQAGTRRQATAAARQMPPAPRRAQPQQRPRQTRPLKDLVMFALVLFVVPLLGIIGLIYRPMLWVFVGACGVCLAALWLLNCFPMGSRALISGLLLVLTVVSVITLVDLSPREDRFQTIGGGDPSQVASASNAGGTGAQSAAAGGYDVFPGLSTQDTVPQGDATITDASQEAAVQPTAVPTEPPRSAAYFTGSTQSAQTEAQPQTAEVPAEGTQLAATGTDVTGGVVGSIGAADANAEANTPAYASLPGMEAAAAPLNQALSGAQAALDGYLNAWSAGDYAEMLKYSLPSWVNAQKSPQQQLFWNHNWWILDSWTLSSDVMSPTADAVTVRVIADMTKRSSNRNTARQQYSAIVYNKDGAWYVDPASMRTGLPVEEPTAAPQAGAAATDAPEATIDPGTLLWYNKDGGKYYHAVEKCPEINEKYYESMASFKYSQLSEESFSALLPHAACDAPEKP